MENIGISRHALRRYVERVVGIEDQMEVERYVMQHTDVIVENIKKLNEHSIFVYKGQIGGDKTTATFWLRDNIVLIKDVNNTKIITLYYVDFGFPEKATRTIIKDLMEDIAQHNIDFEEEKKRVDDYLELKKEEIENIDHQIKLLKDQEEQLLFQKRVAKEDMEAKQANLIIIGKKIDYTANLLCNSVAFKRDMKNNVFKD